MKNIFFIFLSCTFLFLSCKKDESTTTIELRYDGDYFSSPALPAGTFDAGQRFPSNIVDNYVGKTLDEVEFYIQDKPADCEILIYAEGTASSPGALVYSQNVINQVSANSWNTHTLSTPVEIKNEDLWIVVRLIHNSEIRSIGCDEGPASENGDWMLGEGRTEWDTYREISNQTVSVNWNIRGILSEE
jgi:hypothetical protein